MKRLSFTLFFLLSLTCFSQGKLDSLRKVWADPARPDTIRMYAMQRLCLQGYLYSRPDSAFFYAQQLYAKAVEARSEKFQSAALNLLGAASSIQGDNTHAIEYFTKSLKLIENTNDARGISNALNNIGVIYDGQGDYKKALSYYLRAMKVAESQKSSHLLILSYCNLGNTYRNLGNYPLSIEYLDLALKMSEESLDSMSIGIALHSAGVTYFDAQNYDKALDYNIRSIPYFKAVGDMQGLAEALNIIGNTYKVKGNIDQAISFNKQSLEIAQSALLTANIREASQALFDLYKLKGNYREALAMHELFIAMKDSVTSADSQKELLKQELTYNYEKQKALEAKEHEKQLAIAAEQKQKQKVISYAIAVGMLIVLLFAFFVVQRLRLTRKQKMIIEHQKDVVEEKQKEILDSITYAKRLQEAILPTESYIAKVLKESFVLYKPKDIVAGDFYWMEVINNDTILMAAADCTGHGVPGAMVSVVCSNALNRAVLEFGITEPGLILDKTRELVLETFSRSDKDVKDGMDISLISLNLNNAEVKWAGANNPLWYISGGKFNEISADKQPIGSSFNAKPFTTHRLLLQKGDLIYLFTDGYADQFGGPKGKKFKYKPLKDLLSENHKLSCEEQKKILDDAFISWKEGLEQVDDVCMIGIRI
ncbi:MAG: protein serine/threonine phosphatase [Bacteroidota bacterium]|jgi:serine phosphatase RsbU (regulator of sigma subunit)|nr:protein serine/threonine phosphatase [Bacteroidota bacterium]